MRLDCLIGHHKPLPANIRNQGFEFGTCSRCGRDMVRSGRSWRGVPRGFRVVWRQSARRAAAAHAAASGRRRRGATHATGHVPARRRPAGLARRAVGLGDLLRAAMRVLLWAVSDRWKGLSMRGIGIWMRALPGRETALPLPPP
ncbi:hypothetical protein [Sphingosinicella terrae]|uniref:hypothetical protein n=1 Tax=Sphingosinicella terrae TaxID=2172047 RepID=UPI000E0CD615|nr:hypothetical protein [Sphingosinicella terrae]